MKINLFQLSNILLASSLSITAAIPVYGLTNVSSEQLISQRESIKQDSQVTQKDNTASWILFIGSPIFIVLIFILIAKANGGSSRNTARNSGYFGGSSFSAGELGGSSFDGGGDFGGSSSDGGGCSGGDFGGGDCGGGGF